MPKPLPDVQVNKNTILHLLPICQIDKNVHIRFYSTKGEAHINLDKKSLKTRSKTNAYLVYMPTKYQYWLLQDGDSGPKSAVSLAQIERCDFEDSIWVCEKRSKQFKLAGIEVSWKLTESNELELAFYVNRDSISNNLEDIDETIKEFYKHEVAIAMNRFFAEKRPPFPKFIDLCKKYVSSKSSDKSQPFLDGLEKLSAKWKVSENFAIREEFLNCQLMKYQKKTVKWMIEKELKPEKIDLSKILECVKLVTPTALNNYKSLFYYPVLGLFTETNMLDSISAPRGGILADEMGLGKTVEVLSLIVSHRKGEKVRLESKASTNKKKKPASLQKHLDWEEYKAAKSGEKSSRSKAVYTVTPEEMNEKTPGSCQKCANCGDMCDLEKSGWKKEFEKTNRKKKKVSFWCPQCMGTQEPLEVKTTLIVLPESLMMQWYNEISKHCSEDLKVMFYFGINKTGYLHPLEIAKFDIILTAYTTLTAEFGFSDLKTDSQRSANIYKFSPTSLTHVKWWRLIADESQLVEGASNRAAKMCTKIESHHRWCMTGTPIVRSVADLGGLFRIIGLWPFNVEQFWKNHVVAEFLDMSENKKNLSTSCLLQIAAQLMRRNTKKMVANEIHLPKLIQIEKLVKFTKIEESQYKKEMGDLRKQVKNAIGNVPNEMLLSQMARKEKTLVALGKLKETLISCGEHTNFSKCKNVNEQVMSDPKNVMFRLLRAKKSQINEYLKSTLSTLYHFVEILWLRNNMERTVDGYEQVGDIFLMIDVLNEDFDRVLGPNEATVEEIDIDDEENCQPSCSTISNQRKRGIEDEEEEVLPRKVAKLEGEEDEQDKVRLDAEEKAKKAMLEMRKNAMRPIVVDPQSSVRFAVSMQELETFPILAEKLEAVKAKMGGVPEMERKLAIVLKEYSTDEMEMLQTAKNEQIEIFEDWETNKDQHIPMMNILDSVKKSYRSKDSKEFLIEKLVTSDRMPMLLREMPFWPVFANSVQHFKDGAVEQKSTSEYDLRMGHNDEVCMGICNQKHVEVISRDYEHSTSSQVLQKMQDFIDNLETMREELLNGYMNLIDFFMKNSPSELLLMNGSDTLDCEHNKFQNATMCIDEQSRKRENEPLKCHICSVFHTLAHLKFAIGTGSYHGKINNYSRKPIDSFFSLVFSIEAKRNAQFDGAKQLSEFQEYLKRLRQTTNLIQSSFDSIINYNSCMKELISTKERVTVKRLRQFRVADENWSDEQVTEYFVERYEQCYKAIYAKLNASCKELRYLMSLYEKEQSSSNEANSEEGDEDNCCPICYLELQIVSNYPCGHKSCESCYQILRNRSKCENCLQCVTCRKFFKHSDVITERRKVTAAPDSEQSVIPGMTLAVKLETTIRLMKEIIEEDAENNKILLFTTLGFRTPIWQFLTKVLQKAKMPFVEVTRTDYGKSLSDFEFSADCKILLCSLPMCANGLNLTQANHIIFLDPSHLFSVVEQAIGRMHRFGQKRDMKVYHMLVEGSIDEEIRKIVKATKGDPEEHQEDNKLTVGELRQIFGITQ